MSTVYSTHQQGPFGDDMQAYDACPPAPGINSVGRTTSAMNMYGSLSQSHWTQWWCPAEDASSAEATNMNAPKIFSQQGTQYHCTYDRQIPTRWESPALLTHVYPFPSPTIDQNSMEIPKGDIDSRRSTSSIESDKQKRKRSTAMPEKRMPTKAVIQATYEKSKRCGNKVKPASQPTEEPSPQSDGGLDWYSKKLKEKNRIASRKLHARKRKDKIKLQANEKNLEQIN